MRTLALSASTICGDGRASRTRLLTELLATVDADVAGFWSLSEADGQHQLREFIVVGRAASDQMKAQWEREVLPRLPIRPDRLRTAETKAFFEDAVLNLEGVPWQESSMFRRFFTPFGLGSQIRLLVEEGGRFYGYVGLLRLGERPRFSRHARRRLAPLAAGVSQAVIASHRVEESLAPGDLVCGADGRVEHASDAGRVWLQHAALTEALPRVVAAADRGGPMSGTVGVGRFVLTRLDGASVRYLVHIDPCAVPVDRLAGLTDTQREIAEGAAAGASIVEMAETLGRSPETVRTHLREVYRRLDVHTRLELRDRLAHG